MIKAKIFLCYSSCEKRFLYNDHRLYENLQISHTLNVGEITVMIYSYPVEKL